LKEYDEAMELILKINDPEKKATNFKNEIKSIEFM